MAEDFTPRAVNRAVLAETLQHPLTMLPAATGVVGGLYIGLLGLDPRSFAITLVSSLVAAGVWVVNYFLRGETFAQRHVEQLQARRLALRQEEVDHLVVGWQATEHAEGIKQVEELRAAYEQLRNFLVAGLAPGKSQGLGLRRLVILAEDTFREGVAILRQALALQQALASVDQKDLKQELNRWQKQRAKKTGSETLATRIVAHEKLLELCAEQAAAIDRLLAESETLESALQSTYLEAAQLESPELLFARGHTASELERAVHAARRVEDRLKAGERQAAAGDEVYLAAGEVSQRATGERA